MGSIYDSIPAVELKEGSWDEQIPLGPDGLLQGTLPNGVKYYVRKCSKPKQRAALALAVKVGSVAEEEHERGVAHILEHLAFNATENYSNHDIVSFLESIGASFGACQNAYTSADETCYTLMVPTSDWGLVDKSLAVLAEFAFRIRCAPEDLSRERGAVMEEWRMGQDSAGRTQEAHWKLLLEGSKYAERLPIGLKSVIQRVPAQVVRDFHRRWYRPHNMALVAVGDFEDPADVVRSITQYMSSSDSTAEGCKQQGALPLVEVPTSPWVPHTEPRCCVFVDREAQDSVVYASFKQDALNISTAAEFLEHLTDSLFQKCLNNRLFRLSRLPEPPFFAASVGDEALCRVVDLLVVSAITQDGATLTALECLLTEVARVRCHGFTDKEVEKARRSLQAEIESTFTEHDQGYCTEIRDEYVRHFLTGEFVTGQDYEARLSKALLPRISREDIEARAQLLKHTNSAVYKTVEHRKHHSEAQLRAVVMKVAAAEAAGEIGVWEEMDSPDELMAAEPAVPAQWREAHQLGLREQEGATATTTSSSSSGGGGGGLGGQEQQQRVAGLKGGQLGAAAAGGGAHKGCVCHGGEPGSSSQPDLNSSSSSGRATGSLQAAAENGSHDSRGREAALPPGAAGGGGGAAEDPPAASQASTAAAAETTAPGEEGQTAAAAAAAAEACLGDLPAMPLAPGVVSQRHYPQLQAVELLLVNGMRVALKETDFLKDEVLISGVATGGLSEVPREQFLNAMMSMVVASQLGVFGHKPEVQNEILAGKRLELSPSEGAYSHSFKGSASPSDLREAMQLIHLLMTTRVAVVQSELASVMVQVRQGVEAQLRNPLFHYHNRVRLINYGGCYYFEPITLEDLDKLDPHAACAHHTASYCNPSEVSVVFTGNISLTALLPLISTYLATIPPVEAAPQQEAGADGASGGSGPWYTRVHPHRGLSPLDVTPLPFSFPETPVVEDVEVDMVSPLTQSQITFPVSLPRPTAKEELVWISLACRLLETRLLQTLRFRFGNVYTVSVSPFFGVEAPSRQGDLRGDVSIAFTCDPTNKGKLVEMTLAGLEQLQQQEPTPQEVETLRTLEQLEWENSQAENSFWHDIMAGGYQSRSFAENNNLDECYDRTVKAREVVMAALSPATMQAAMQRLFPCPCRSRYTAITMMPQPPSWLQRLAFGATHLLLRFTGGHQPQEAALGRERSSLHDSSGGSSMGRAVSGRLPPGLEAGGSSSLDKAAAAAAVEGLDREVSWYGSLMGSSRYEKGRWLLLGGAAAAGVAVVCVGVALAARRRSAGT